jgi:ribosome assembly protein 1
LGSLRCGSEFSVFQFLSSNIEKIEKIIKSLNVKILPRELKSKDTRSLLNAIMSQWLPLAHAVLLAVVEKVPDPVTSQPVKMSSIIGNKDYANEEEAIINKAILSCDASESAPVACYLSKIFAVPAKDLPLISNSESEAKQIEDARRLAIARSKARQLDRENDLTEIVVNEAPPPEETASGEVLVGFARVFSGIIKVGQKIHVFAPKYSSEREDKAQYHSEMIVERLFLIMGKELSDLKKVPAGNVFGIICSDAEVLKTATLSSSEYCPSLAGLGSYNPPILEVALEPTDPTKLSALVHGLNLLNKADTCVEVTFQETGENVIKCAGELHLEVFNANLALHQGFEREICQNRYYSLQTIGSLSRDISTAPGNQ